MKFIKTLAAAAVLAAVSLPSQAYVTQANNGSTELFLVIGDENGSFLLDTGVTVASVLSSPASFTRAVASAAWTAYSAADTNLFDGASNRTTGTRWALFAYDGATLADFSAHSVITTAGKGLTTASFAFDAGTMVQSNSAMGSVAQQANGTGTHPTLANGTSYNLKGTTAYFGTNFFKFFAGNTFIGNTVGDSSSLYLLKGDAELSDDPLAPVIATKLGLTANFDGTSLTVSAVPEPESIALMAAGLAAIGFVVRRRRAD